VLAGIGRKRSRRKMAIVLGMVLILTTFALVGCGGSNSSTPNNPGTPGTPAGNYTVTVTAAGTGTGSPTHTMNVTLVVQ
jgi:ABC-type glycerol-3-phosphate transport system substrate-binding protein